ncbi:hypothetical protein V2I01_29270 [Micromonospora sp. BRA006-A]|nr:hypothetical protein [Micromonospora sp. BRA006-A]
MRRWLHVLALAGAATAVLAGCAQVHRADGDLIDDWRRCRCRSCSSRRPRPACPG